MEDVSSLVPTFDRDGYPTDETLRVIETWPFTRPGLLEYVREAWTYGPININTTLSDAERQVLYVDDDDDEVWRFVTGGWSGNESLIAALEANYVMWQMVYVGHVRGGVWYLKRLKAGS